MKKLLTLLLTFVMAICLVNLKSSYIMADENGAAELNLIKILNVQGVINKPIKQLVFTKDETMPSGYSDKTSDITGALQPEYNIGKYFFNDTDFRLIIANANGFTYNNGLSGQGAGLFQSLQFLETIEFNDCVSLASNATDLSFMFDACANLYAVDLSWMNTTNVVSMYQMFRGCSNLHHILVSDKFVTTNVTTYNDMFTGCDNLVGGNGTKFNSALDFKQYAKIDKEGQAGYLTDKENGPIYCYGIQYDGITTGGKTGWNEMKEGEPWYYAPIDSLRLKELGISMNGNTASLSKSLTTSKSYPTLNIVAPLNLVVDKNISIVNKNDNWPCIETGNVNNIVMNGKGHTLTLTAKLIAIGTSAKLTLDNIIVKAKNNSSSQPTIFSTNDIALKGDSILELNNDNNSGHALIQMGDNLKVVSNKTPMGDKSGTLEEAELRKLGNPNYYAYALKSSPMNSTFVTHLILTNAQDKPTPSPSKKDESCEKVIGPTWHWNNTKGICEDYGVVGTSTR